MAENSGRMRGKTEAKRKASAGISHPYRRYEGTIPWLRINKALDALIQNGDLEEKTNRLYITGYICHILCEGK
jgi:hypothetical protein